MLGIMLGNYRILEELGSGGMGVVYRATAVEPAPELEAGAPVALKVLRPELLEHEGFEDRFRREVEIGQRVRHANVVSTYGMGTAESGGTRFLYLCMEYVQGRSLREMLEAGGSVPESLLREIASQVAAGLSALHQAGVLHCDLKPENVLLTKDHQVRIMDLGISRLLDEVGLPPRPGEFSGSLLYAAPEQFRPEGMGRTTDLYAMGVLLYELATAKNPFQRPDAGAVIRAQLEETPPPVGQCVPELSPFMAELISTLLQKDPADRPPSAAFVGELLRLGERSPWWSSRACRLVHARQHRPQISVIREARLHGRSRELRVLHAAWELAREGSGQAVLLEGVAGVGKTRLINAFYRGLDARRAHVLFGTYPGSGERGGISAAILEHFGEAHLEQALQPYLQHESAQISPFASIVKHVLPPHGCEPVLRSVLHELVVQLMAGMAAQKPMVWTLDDLQLAGPDSCEIVLSMAEAVVGQRMLLILATGPGLCDDVLSRLEGMPQVTRCTLSRLSPSRVIRLLTDVLHSRELAAMLGDRMTLKSDGIPLFVLEMARGLRNGQFIRQRSDGSYMLARPLDELEVPSAVQDLIEARLAHLSPIERAILDVGAVQGVTFDAELVAGVLDMQPIKVLERLAQIEQRSALVRAAGGRSLFDYHQVQEHVYVALTEAQRLAHHTALADAFSACRGPEGGAAGQARRCLAGSEAVFMATHHLKGKRPASALPYLDGALDHLENTYRNKLLVELIERALNIPDHLEIWRRTHLTRRKIERLSYLSDSVEGSYTFL